jgi:formin 2
LFIDKTKPKAAAVVDTGTVDLNKPKTFFAADKGQQLFIILSRLPSKPKAFCDAVDLLNDKVVSGDNLESLIKAWPADEFDDLIREAKENPGDKWDKTEAYFIALGEKKHFFNRIKIWYFYMKFDGQIKSLMQQLETVSTGFKKIKSNEKFMIILGAILKVGNCLNAGNKSRGQADGYQLDALSKTLSIKD